MADWMPVTRARPCQVCGKPDWCLVAPDGLAQLCNRVQSDRPGRNGGWLHGAPQPLAAPVARPVARPRYDSPDYDAGLWWATARHVARIERLAPWARQLGLPVACLDWLGAATIGEMLTFPMHDGLGNVCGVRTRLPDGSKRAVTGSRAGVFLATVPLDGLDVLVCEGPTDAAAAMALGYEPIGRPSCQGQEVHVLDTLRRWKRDRATVCADADGPGIDGAERLADALRAGRVQVRMVAPAGGHKDLRDWLRAGATRDKVEAAWAMAKWC